MKISIIVPVYNVAHYIERCVLSCLKQTFSNIEIICINDGSTDCSGSLLDTMASSDSRVKVFHQKNHGVVTARSRGVNYSVGEYIFFLDGDDYLQDDSIESLAELLKNDDWDIIVGDYCTVLDDEERATISSGTFDCGNGVEYLRALFTTGDGYLWRMLIKRSILDEVHVPANCIMCEDWLAVIQMATVAKKIVHIPKNVYWYRQRVGSTITLNSEISFDSIEIVENEALAVLKAKGLYEKLYVECHVFFLRLWGILLINGGIRRVSWRVQRYLISWFSHSPRDFIDTVKMVSPYPGYRLMWFMALLSPYLSGKIYLLSNSLLSRFIRLRGKKVVLKS
jgi:glycosyltransferase involved in cell wall biosynthesis